MFFETFFDVTVTSNYLSTTAMRNVMAGTEFCIADAKVGDVLSKPSK